MAGSIRSLRRHQRRARFLSSSEAFSLEQWASLSSVGDRDALLERRQTEMALGLFRPESQYDLRDLVCVAANNGGAFSWWGPDGNMLLNRSEPYAGGLAIVCVPRAALGH